MDYSILFSLFTKFYDLFEGLLTDPLFVFCLLLSLTLPLFCFTLNFIRGRFS